MSKCKFLLLKYCLQEETSDDETTVTRSETESNYSRPESPSKVSHGPPVQSVGMDNQQIPTDVKSLQYDTDRLEDLIHPKQPADIDAV